MSKVDTELYLKNKFREYQKQVILIAKEINNLKEDDPSEAQARMALSVDYGAALHRLQEIREISESLFGEDYEDIIDPEVKNFCVTYKPIFYAFKGELKLSKNDLSMEEFLDKIKKRG